VLSFFGAAARLCAGHPALRAGGAGCVSCCTGALEVTQTVMAVVAAFTLTPEKCLGGFACRNTLRMNQEVTGGPARKCGNVKISGHMKK